MRGTEEESRNIRAGNHIQVRPRAPTPRRSSTRAPPPTLPSHPAILTHSLPCPQYSPSRLALTSYLLPSTLSYISLLQCLASPLSLVLSILPSSFLLLCFLHFPFPPLPSFSLLSVTSTSYVLPFLPYLLPSPSPLCCRGGRH